MGSQQSSPSLCSPQQQHEAEPGIWRDGQADGEAPRSRCATTRSPAAMTPARIAMLVEASMEVPRTEEVSGNGAELAGGADSSEATVRLVASSADLAAAMLASHGRIPLSIAQTKRWRGMLSQLVRYAWGLIGKELSRNLEWTVLRKNRPIWIHYLIL